MGECGGCPNTFDACPNPALVVPLVVNLDTLFTGGSLLISLTVMTLAEPSLSILLGSKSLLRVLVGGRFSALEGFGLHHAPVTELLTASPGKLTTLSSGMKYLQCKEFHLCFR